MNPYLYIPIALAGVLVIIVAVMIIRAIAAGKPDTQSPSSADYDLDANQIADRLAQAVRIPTVSMVGNYKDNAEAFYDFRDFLEKTYPALNAAATRHIINGFSIVYEIKGSDPSLKPGAYLAHQDVVPAPAEGWEVPPFSGEIKDGFVYGRGSADMKGQLIALVEAVEELLKQGFVPKRDIFLCFGHDEEPMDSMEGAPKIAAWLKERGIELEFVVDEGGTILDGNLLGINNTVALIGTCEKGYCDYVLTCEKPGGHASNPARPSSLAILGKAIDKLERHPMKAKLTPVTKQTFKTLAPHMKFPLKFIFVNIDLLGWLIKPVMSLIPITNALIRTTFAPTMAKGSDTPNVIPPKSEANINCRILTGESVKEVADYIQKTVGPKIKVSYAESNEPTPVSSTDTDAYRNLISAISMSFPGLVTAPYMFIAADDAKYYAPVCKNIYRFTPFMMTLDDQKRIHAINERTGVQAMKDATVFFMNAIKKMC